MGASGCALTSKPLRRGTAPAARKRSACSAADRLLRRHSRARFDGRQLAELGYRRKARKQSFNRNSRSASSGPPTQAFRVPLCRQPQPIRNALNSAEMVAAHAASWQSASTFRVVRTAQRRQCIMILQRSGALRIATHEASSGCARSEAAPH
jgi:hypothetical protein